VAREIQVYKCINIQGNVTGETLGEKNRAANQDSCLGIPLL
jgi:hypothetical protein